VNLPWRLFCLEAGFGGGYFEREVSMDKRSTYGLRTDQMAVLFALGGEDPNSAGQYDAQENVAGLLNALLTCTRPEDSLFRDTLQMMMGQAGCDPGVLTGKSLCNVLLSPQPDLDLLRTIKDCSKTLSNSLDSELDTALATTIYFAALASALVFHSRKISQNTYGKLDDSFTLLREKPWMAQELADLFSQARHICQSNGAGNETA